MAHKIGPIDLKLGTVERDASEPFWNYNLWQYLFELGSMDERSMTASQKSHLAFLLSSLGC